MNYIYLHGFASSPQSTKARFFVERFRELGITVNVPELAPDFERLTITGQLEVVRRAAAGDECVLMGSSLGGYLAALHAARNPLVRRLVLLAPAFGFPRRWPEALGPDKMQAWEQNGTMTVYHYGEKRDRELGFALMADARQYEDFPEFDQPALILHGKGDTVVPVTYSEEFAARRSHVRLLAVQSGHELTDVMDLLWEETARFLELV